MPASLCRCLNGGGDDGRATSVHWRSESAARTIKRVRHFVIIAAGLCLMALVIVEGASAADTPDTQELLRRRRDKGEIDGHGLLQGKTRLLAVEKNPNDELKDSLRVRRFLKKAAIGVTAVGAVGGLGAYLFNKYRGRKKKKGRISSTRGHDGHRRSNDTPKRKKSRIKEGSTSSWWERLG